MPLIPIGTEFRTRRPPVANWVLIGLNVVIFLFTDFLGGQAGAQLKAYYALDAARPALAQYLTYQFLHGDVWHLAGNMLFLWIFGNAVCDRMGGAGYVLFYLAGGVIAAWRLRRARRTRWSVHPGPSPP
jgi:membrane associated rhomboid family serine protease